MMKDFIVQEKISLMQLKMNMNLKKFKFEIAKNANNDKIWKEVRKLFF